MELVVFAVTVTDPEIGGEESPENNLSSLSTGAARNLATTTKTVPQMQEITSRWLLRLLPWIEVKGGAYRVNRRLTYTVGDGRIDFDTSGAEIRVIPRELGEFSQLRDFDDDAVLTELAGRFTRRDFEPGEVLAEFGQPAGAVVLLAHGKVSKIGTGEYGDETVLGTLADGDFFGGEVLIQSDARWEFTAKAVTAGTAMVLSRDEFQRVLAESESLRSHLASVEADPEPAHNDHGEAAIDLAAGHSGEPDLPLTFVDYQLSPREYELSVAQTVLKVHSRVVDLYNDPINQLEQQLRLIIEALYEKQEDELVNNRDFGLLHNADLKQRIHTRTGPPTPDDLDELLATVWKDPGFFLAHPRAIAAFGRECSKRGIYPDTIDHGGHSVPAWRGVPILPCNKIGISRTRTSSIMLMRTGEENQGVVGLHQTGLADEYRPGVSVRFMGIDTKAVISYLVSTYYSAAVLIPDALGILDSVEIGRES